jgi:hypothetical protein
LKLARQDDGYRIEENRHDDKQRADIKCPHAGVDDE